MAKTFQVTGACVTNVPVTGAQGTQLATFYAGHLLPADVPADRIKHLLSVGLIAEIGDSTPKTAEVSAPVSSQGGGASTAVNARSSKADLVEHGVAQGGDRAKLDALTREQLLDRYVRQQ